MPDNSRRSTDTINVTMPVSALELMFNACSRAEQSAEHGDKLDQQTEKELAELATWAHQKLIDNNIEPNERRRQGFRTSQRNQ